MKCANPNCNRGIGLITYRHGWFGTYRYCSEQCRDVFVTEPPKQSQRGRRAATYFERLFLQTLENPQPRLRPAVIRMRQRNSVCDKAQEKRA
jgi:hypothetical protein